MNAIWLPDWTVTELRTSGQIVTAEAKYGLIPEACPRCGVVGRLYGHGSKQVVYRDAPAFGKQLVLNVEVKRFKCRDCGVTSMQPLPDMHPQRQLTKRCVEHVLEQCLSRKYAEVARETGVDESVVRAVCNEEYEEVIQTHRPYAPTVLGIDELTILHHRRCIFVDVGTKRTIDILPSMRMDAVTRWLSLLPDRDRIQIVTMDMWDNYRQAVRGLLPRAIIVVDRWHIQSKAGAALDRVRSRVRRGSKNKKNPWRLKRVLQTSRHRLKPQTMLLLDGMLKNDPLLSAAWHTKEAFYDIWDAGNRREAEVAYEAWKAAIPEIVAGEFGAVAKTVDNWHEEVFAYFSHRYTNAFTENTNGLIKEINRAGRGYRFPTIRAKAILMRRASDGQFSVCECCLGQFSAGSLERVHVPPFRKLTGSSMPKRMMFCEACHKRFHTEGWFRPQGDSTLKNG